MKKIILFLIFISVILITYLTFKVSDKQDKVSNNVVTTDTIYIIQVIHDTIPQLVVERIKEIKIDTLYSVDSIYTPILLPIEERIYENEITTAKLDTIQYRASVTGYRASLDSIDIAIKYKQYNTTMITNKNKKWIDGFYISPSVGLGYGLINKKCDIYLGVGVGCKINW